MQNCHDMQPAYAVCQVQTHGQEDFLCKTRDIKNNHQEWLNTHTGQI